jgi:hypothetical protein
VFLPFPIRFADQPDPAVYPLISGFLPCFISLLRNPGVYKP